MIDHKKNHCNMRFTCKCDFEEDDSPRIRKKKAGTYLFKVFQQVYYVTGVYTKILETYLRFPPTFLMSPSILITVDFQVSPIGLLFGV